MAPPSEKQTKVPLHCPDSSESIRQLVSLLNQYCSGGSFDSLKVIVQENEELKRDTAKLQAAYDTNIQALSRYQAESKRQKDDLEKQLSSQKAQNETTLKAKQAVEDSIKKHKAELAALQNKLEIQSSSAKQLMSTIEKKNKEISLFEANKSLQGEKMAKAEKELTTLRSTRESMQSRIDDLTKSLEEAQGRLMTFRSIMVELDRFEAKRAEVGDALDSILNNGLRFMEWSIGADLDDACLADMAIWGRVRSHTLIQRTIPLPASNSPVAKQMRIAAGLRVYSMALADHVFRSTYLTLNNDLDDVLRDLEADDPLHEVYARAILLKIQPAKQPRTREDRAKMVVGQVSDVIAGLVPSSRRETFETRLHQLSMEACDAWSIAQHLVEPIRPVFSSHVFEDWVAFPSSAAQHNNKAGPTSDTRQPLEMRTEMSDRQSQSPTSESRLIETDDIIQVVWPAFSVPSSQQEDDVGNQVPEVVHRGYVITRSQIKDAEIEMSRRTARKNARQNSVSSSAQKKRRDSAVFLSKGFSTGISTDKDH
ncbi:hypothetical protein ACLX1H_002833 [Fusarium chlamydosporum]